MNYEFEEGCAVLMIIKKDHQKQFVAEQRKFDQLKNAVFISKDKICALTNKGSLYLYSFDGKSKQVDWIKDSTIDNIYQATVGKILVKCQDTIYLYDIQGRKIIGEQSISGMK